MSLLLARIDDRLVHGQVVVGCCESLRVSRILLCDDTVAGDSILRGLFALATPTGVAFEVRRVADTPARLEELERSGEANSTLLLVARSVIMLRLVQLGAKIQEVNLGGAHGGTEATELWPGFFLIDDDRAALGALIDRGVQVKVQTVPGAGCIDAAARLAPGSS